MIKALSAKGNMSNIPDIIFSAKTSIFKTAPRSTEILTIAWRRFSASSSTSGELSRGSERNVLDASIVALNRVLPFSSGVITKESADESVDEFSNFPSDGELLFAPGGTFPCP